jgi:hypothetical protein
MRSQFGIELHSACECVLVLAFSYGSGVLRFPIDSKAERVVNRRFIYRQTRRFSLERQSGWASAFIKAQVKEPRRMSK